MIEEQTTVAPVTVIFTWEVAAGREAEFEQWAHGITDAATRFPGHLGANWLRPAPGKHDYHTVLRFDKLEHFTAWEQSPERAAWLARAATYVREHKLQSTGLESWFTLPGLHPVQPPPRWKMYLTTLLAVFPLSLMLQLSIAPFLSRSVLVLRTAALSFVLVTLLTFLVMPHLTKLLRFWLYPER